ncbi:unnamed protein product [Trichogramma brassicae]|uniref:Uncharacterized protein n=1 Tax=Trichogramma brassicae TaxID=86971 RepID=A0A6H5IBK4_9HYME|nr:unnamed protein product [Trichogramma brassicae]
MLLRRCIGQSSGIQCGAEEQRFQSSKNRNLQSLRRGHQGLYSRGNGHVPGAIVARERRLCVSRRIKYVYTLEMFFIRKKLKKNVLHSVSACRKQLRHEVQGQGRAAGQGLLRPRLHPADLGRELSGGLASPGHGRQAAAAARAGGARHPIVHAGQHLVLEGQGQAETDRREQEQIRHDDQGDQRGRVHQCEITRASKETMEDLRKESSRAEEEETSVASIALPHQSVRRKQRQPERGDFVRTIHRRQGSRGPIVRVPSFHDHERVRQLVRRSLVPSEQATSRGRRPPSPHGDDRELGAPRFVLGRRSSVVEAEAGSDAIGGWLVRLRGRRQDVHALDGGVQGSLRADRGQGPSRGPTESFEGFSLDSQIYLPQRCHTPGHTLVRESRLRSFRPYANDRRGLGRRRNGSLARRGGLRPQRRGQHGHKSAAAGRVLLQLRRGRGAAGGRRGREEYHLRRWPVQAPIRVQFIGSHESHRHIGDSAALRISLERLSLLSSCAILGGPGIQALAFCHAHRGVDTS